MYYYYLVWNRHSSGFGWRGVYRLVPPVERCRIRCHASSFTALRKHIIYLSSLRSFVWTVLCLNCVSYFFLQIWNLDIDAHEFLFELTLPEFAQGMTQS